MNDTVTRTNRERRCEVNAIRKAPEHKRTSHRPKVSAAGLRVLRWLSVHLLEFVDDTYWNEWHGAEYEGKPRLSLRVSSTTIRALADRGLVRVARAFAEVTWVEITTDGHDYLERRNNEQQVA